MEALRKEVRDVKQCLNIRIVESDSFKEEIRSLVNQIQTTTEMCRNMEEENFNLRSQQSAYKRKQKESLAELKKLFAEIKTAVGNVEQALNKGDEH